MVFIYGKGAASAAPFPYLGLLVVHGGHVADQFHHPVGVAALVDLALSAKIPIKRLKIHRFRYDSLTIFALVYYQGS